MNKKRLDEVYRELLRFYRRKEMIPLEVFASSIHMDVKEAQTILDSLGEPEREKNYEEVEADLKTFATMPVVAKEPTPDPPKITSKSGNSRLTGGIMVAANFILILLNSAITVYLFITFGSTPWLKVFWAMYGLVIMFSQIFFLKKFKSTPWGVKRTQFLVAYIFATFFSMVGSTGFTLSEIAHGQKVTQSAVIQIDDSQEDVSYYKKKIDGLSLEIDGLRGENLEADTPAWKRSENNASMKRLQAELAKAEGLWQEAKKERVVLVKEDSKKIETKNSIDYISEALRIIPFFSALTGRALKSFLMLLLSFMFEYFLYITTKGLEEE